MRRQFSLTAVLNHYQRNDKGIQFWDSIFLSVLVKTSRLFRKNIDVDVKRFIEANNLISSRKAESSGKKSRSQENIDLVIVASDKDFHTLPLCITFAIRSLDHFFSGHVFVVVPARQIQTCKKILKHANIGNSKVINEENLVSSRNRKILRAKFGNRYGWVLQQLLKVSQVLRSESKYALIVDSDTILITKRQWIEEERTLLSVSWEFHSSYYVFLNRFGIGDKIPRYTFVTHHMLMNRKYLQSALKQAGFKELDDLVNVLNEGHWDNGSPFCLEYELYGQYMYQFQNEKIRIEKWGNRAVHWNVIKNLSMEEITNIFRNYDSISAHSYLEGEHSS
jgi:hypothetical protein